MRRALGGVYFPSLHRVCCPAEAILRHSEQHGVSRHGLYPARCLPHLPDEEETGGVGVN